MSNYNLHVAIICLLVTLGLQALSPRIPPTLLTAAHIVQVLLGAASILFFAQLLVSRVGV